MTAVRFEFAALAEAMRMTEPQAARELGLSGSTEQRYRRDGLTEKVAERLAVKAGFHAFTVWPALTDAVLDDEMIECALPECPERFVPSRKGHLFCDPAHARKVWARTERGKASLSAAGKRYRADVKDYLAAQEKKRRAANRERRREVQRAWAAANRDRLLARRREKYRANAEVERARARARYWAKKAA